MGFFGDLLNGITGGIPQLIGSALGVVNTANTNAANQALNEKNLKFAKYQYEDSKRYNSARQVVDRLRAAGINPALAFGGGSTGIVGASSVSPPSPIAMQPYDLSGMASLTDSFMLNASRKDLNKQEIALRKIETDTKAFELNLNKIFGPALKQGQCQKLVADALLSFQESKLAQIKGDTERSQQRLNDATKALHESMKYLNDEQKKMVQKEVAWYDAKAQAALANVKADTASKRADVPLKKSQEAFNYAGAENQKAQAALSRFETSLREATAPSDIAKAASDAVIAFNNEGITGWQAKAAEYAAESARVQANHAEALFWRDFILDSVEQGLGAITSFKNARSWERMSKSQQKRTEARVRQIEHDMKKETSSTTWEKKNGQWKAKSAVVTRQR